MCGIRIGAEWRCHVLTVFIRCCWCFLWTTSVFRIFMNDAFPPSPHLFFFFFAEIERIQKGETKKEPEKETYLDLFATKNLKLKERVLIPTKQYPKVSMSRWIYTVVLTSSLTMITHVGWHMFIVGCLIEVRKINFLKCSWYFSSAFFTSICVCVIVCHLVCQSNIHHFSRVG